jgi:hypothetical protein
MAKGSGGKKGGPMKTPSATKPKGMPAGKAATEQAGKGGGGKGATGRGK